MTTKSKSLHDVLLSQFVAGKQRSEDGNDPKLDENSVSLKFVRVLKASPSAKRICIECLYQDEPAILVLEKTAFEEEITQHIASNFRYLFESGIIAL